MVVGHCVFWLDDMGQSCLFGDMFGTQETRCTIGGDQKAMLLGDKERGGIAQGIRLDPYRAQARYALKRFEGDDRFILTQDRGILALGRQHLVAAA